MDDLKTKGVAMVFISHHLDEIPRVGDDVSVLRDGTLVGEVPARTSERELVTMMVGRDIDDQFPRHRGEVGEVLLSVTGLSPRKGIFKMSGSTCTPAKCWVWRVWWEPDATEVLRAIAGADKYDSGTVRVRGKELPKGKISRAIVDGIGHVPEERKSQGLVLDASVNENLGYATMKSTSHAGLVDRSGQRRRAQNVAEKLRGQNG